LHQLQSLGYIGIEVARKLIPSTLQMNIVGNDCFACNIGVADQR